MLRAAAALIAAVLLAAAGFATATVFGAAGERPADDGHEPLTGVPGSEKIDGIQPDPARVGPDWGVLVFADDEGRKCAAAGRTDGARVGDLPDDGSIASYPVRDGGSCVDLGIVPAGAQRTIETGADGRTVIHGVAGPEVKSVTLHTPAGARELAIGPRGGFLAVLVADARAGDLAVTARLRSGELRRLLEPRRLPAP